MQVSSETDFSPHLSAQGLDVRSRMAVSVLASAATIALAAPEAQLVLYFMSLIYALTMRQIRLLFLAYGLLLLMSALAFACVQGLHALIPALPAVDFASMLVPFLRMAVMINVVLPLAFASRVQSLLNALQSLRLPFCIYLPATVMIRFIPTFAQDIRQVCDTMKLRGFRPSPRNCFLHPVPGIPFSLHSPSVPFAPLFGRTGNCGGIQGAESRFGERALTSLPGLPLDTTGHCVRTGRPAR